MDIKKILLPVVLIIFSFFNIHNVSASIVFKDVSKSHPLYKEINYLVGLGVINGYKLSDGYYFKPKKSVTRSEVAKMVVLASGNSAKSVTKPSFSDVPMNVMTGYIERAVELGFMEATAKGKFSPNVPIKRNEMSKVLVKAFKLNTETTKNLTIPFKDVGKGNTFYPYVAALYYAGVTNGTGNQLYGIQGEVTRESFATFIARIKSSAYTLPKPKQSTSTAEDVNALARIYVTTDDLNVRSQASASASILGKVHTGDKLNAYAVDGNWVKVSFNNQTAYVSLTYIKFIDINGTTFDLSNSKARTLTQDVVLYRGQSTSTKKIATLKKSQTIKIYGTKGEWTVTEYNGIPGYVLTSNLKEAAASTSTSTPNTTVKVVGRVTADSLNVRQTASSSAAIISKVNYGELVTVQSINGWWAHITVKGVSGYVHKSYLHLMNTSGSSLQNRIIVLDPGHGGSDPGAYNGKVYEKNIVLDVAKRVQKLLETSGAKVILTRSTDVFVDLEKRPQIANQNFGEMFISLHVNSFNTSQPNGTESFYNSKSDANLEEEKRLAQLINSEIVKNAKMLNRGTKDVNYVVTRSTEMPAILVELGFIKNTSDFSKLTSDTYLQIFAESIYKGIVQYYQYK